LIIKDPLSSEIGSIAIRIYKIVGKKLFFVTIDISFKSERDY